MTPNAPISATLADFSAAPAAAPAKGRKRPGAPKGNDHAAKNGLSSLAKSGRVPTRIRGGTYIRRQMRRLRKEAHDEFKALHQRDPSVHEHICIKVLARAEARAMLHENILANEWDSLTHEQRTASLAAIGAAGDQEVRMSKEAGLNRRPDDNPFSFLPELPGDDDNAPPATGDAASEPDPMDCHATPDAAQRQCDSPSEART